MPAEDSRRLDEQGCLTPSRRDARGESDDFGLDGKDRLSWVAQPRAMRAARAAWARASSGCPSAARSPSTVAR